MSAHRDLLDPAAADNEGVTAADLPRMRREVFMDALAVARQEHDPGQAWDAFCETAWRDAGLGLGFVERASWEDLTGPRPDKD